MGNAISSQTDAGAFVEKSWAMKTVEERRKTLSEQKRADLRYRSLSEIVQLPTSADWFETLVCAKCDELVDIRRYYMCDEEGHLTCAHCVNLEPDLLCCFPSSEDNSNGISENGNTTEETVKEEKTVGAEANKLEIEKDPTTCGSKLNYRRHVLVDRLLGELRFHCPNREYGCEVMLDMVAMEDHFPNKCTFEQNLF